MGIYSCIISYNYKGLITSLSKTRATSLKLRLPPQALSLVPSCQTSQAFKFLVPSSHYKYSIPEQIQVNFTTSMT